MNCTTTYCAPAILNKNYKENSHYVVPVRVKARGAVKFCSWMEISCSKEQKKFTNKKARSMFEKLWAVMDGEER